MGNSPRQGRAGAGTRGLALLMGALALILQVTLAPRHVALTGPGEAAIAELTALTGEHLVLCADMQGDHEGDGPAHPTADCSGLCCHLGHGLTASLPSPAAAIVTLERKSVALRLPKRVATSPQPRLSSGQPRGPPTTV